MIYCICGDKEIGIFRYIYIFVYFWTSYIQQYYFYEQPILNAAL